ncbi:MAG TPA: hypothetical protein VMH23_15860, partial [Bacteroidota bacterium]|nr:hypothetical protein [Bacteroidota bacterium]
MQTRRLWCIKSLAVLSLPIVLCTASAQSPFWTPTNVPFGGPVTALTADSAGYIFAGTNRGVFRSSNAGNSWTALPLYRVPSREAFLTDSAGNILAGTDKGIWQSTDHGDSWTLMGLPDSRVSAIIEGARGIIYAGLHYSPPDSVLSPGGVYLSTDAGLTWNPFGLQGQRVDDLVLSPEYGLIALSLGIYRRTQDDSVWTMVSDQWGNTLWGDSTGMLLLGRDLEGVVLSSDGGASWTPTGLRTPYSVVTIAHSAAGTLYAGVMPLDPTIEGGVYSSSDEGSSWVRLGLADWGILCLLTIDEDRVFVGSYRGVFRSTDDGASWQQSNEGITATEIGPLLCVDSTTVFAGTSSGLFLSTDAGATWGESGKGIFPQAIECLAQDTEKNLYAATMVFSPNGGIYKSTDRGTTWRCTSADTISGLYIWINALLVTPTNAVL